MQSDDTGIRNWCEERLADPAEDLYHAVLFAPPRLRGDVRALAALFVELEAIATHFRDLHVARTKLAWWRDEIERLHAGQPGHPVTRLLAAGESDPSNLLLSDLVTGMELILLEGPVTDLATAQMRSERGLARFSGVLTRLFDEASIPAESLVPLGTAAGLVRSLDTADISDEARHDIAGTARRMLARESGAARSAPPPLRVLAALAWNKTSVRVAPGQRRGPRRVFTAWRAARGHLPRNMVRDTA